MAQRCPLNLTSFRGARARSRRAICLDARFTAFLSICAAFEQAGTYFHVLERDTTLTTEIRAGTVTFLTVRLRDSCP